jgi:WD40 repeat protein
MSTPKRPRVFISYAHADGGDLAVRLLGSMQGLGFDVWLDNERLKGGDRWSNEIESALDRAQVVLALLADGSFASELCRAEQAWALTAGKRVIPVKVQSYCLAPLSLFIRLCVDFSDPTNYAESFNELLESISKRRRRARTAVNRPRYNNAPALPLNFVDRPDLLTKLRDVLFKDEPNRNIVLTALQGMGGIGKTVLAQALCHDEVVTRAYPDGIFWFSIGKESRLKFDQRIEGVPGLHQLLGAYKNEQACINQYRTVFRNKAALVVLDDVWRADDIEPFRTESSRSRLLITTRNRGIAPTFGAREFTAELLVAGEAREMLARWAGIEADSLPPQASEVILQCKNLPLALAMIGAQIRGKPRGYWDVVLGHLRRADLASISAQFPEPHTTLFRAIQVSFEALQEADPVAAQRYLGLAVLLEDMAAAPAVQQTLWNVDEPGALETAESLIGLSLAQRDEASGGIRLHDLLLDYVRALTPDSGDLDLIREAIRLSVEVIAKDPYQFASQVIGRLLPHEGTTGIAEFIQRIAQAAPAPWLRPLWPGLRSPGTTLFPRSGGHYAGIDAVAMSADGRLAVSGARDEMLKVWDLVTGRMLCTLEGHRDRVTAVAMTPNGKLAVTAAWNDSLKVWDLENGRVLRTLAGNLCVAVSSDGKRAVAASASNDNILKVWDLETGREIRTLAGHSDSVNAVAVSADWHRAVSASSDHTLMVWDLETGQNLCTLKGHRSDVWAVEMSVDGKCAISASGDTTLRVWDLETAHETRTLEGHTAAVYGVAVSADWRRAVSASHDKTIKVWDVTSGCQIRTLKGHTSFVYNVALSRDGLLAVSASDDTSLKVWDAESGREIHTLAGQSLGLDCPIVSADGRKAIFACGDGTLKVWDLETGRPINTLSAHAGSASSLAASADGRRGLSASWDGVLKVWDIETEHETGTLMSRSSDIWWVAVSGDGRRGVSASDDSTLTVWDLEELRELRTIEGHSGAIYGVAVNADGRRAVSASEDGTLRVWDLESGQQLRALVGHGEPVNNVAISPDGRLVVSASQDKTLKVWNLESGQHLRTLAGHTDAVNYIAVSPDGRQAASASDDKTLKLWDLESGALLTTFTCDAAASCTFVTDKEIIAGDDGGRVNLLSLVEKN